MISAAADRRARQAMHDYLSAGARFDLDSLTASYAPEFVNVRIDRDAPPIVIDRDTMVGHLRGLAADGGRLGPADDARILGTSLCGRYVSVILARTKRGREFLYDFTWDLDGEHARLVRELTTATSGTGARSPARQEPTPPPRY